MAGSDKLASVATVAQSREHAAARDVKNVQQHHDRNNEQLEQLRAFRGEYEERLKAMLAAGLPPRELEDYRRFLDNLNGALDQQQGAVDASRDKLDHHRQDYVEKSLRASTIDQFIARRQATEAQRVDRREQSISDERQAFLASRPNEER